MDYEKKYKDAMGMAEEIIRYYKEHNRGDENSIEDLEQIFPELKESEDERIRKELIFYLGDMPEDTELRNGVTNRDVLAWLEKQGKPITIDIDKMVLKYSQTRETCTNGLPVNCQIRAYRQGINDILENQGEKKPAVTDFNAKDWYVSKVDGKIHDMTYNPADNVEQKQEWSEEDDYNLQCMIAKVTSDIQKGNVGRNNELIDWLKSIKERVQPQPKQEWSEEDEKMANDLIKGCLSSGKSYHLAHTSKEIADWLKSLKSKLQR